jgi:hypothetical protein
MDAKRFDTLARLTTNLSRRGVASLVLTAAATSWRSPDANAKRGRKNGRRCRKRPSLKALLCNKRSRKGCRLEPRPDGTPCGSNSQCLAGDCVLVPPTCQGVEGSACAIGDECCSGDCVDEACRPGAAGKPCLADGDCLSGECFAFACV